MKSVFKELYLGNISPTECRMQPSQDYRIKQRAFREKYDRFTEVLNVVRPDLGQMYGELCDIEVEMEMEDSENLFFQGLSLGIMLVTEAMITAQAGKVS